MFYQLGPRGCVKRHEAWEHIFRKTYFVSMKHFTIEKESSNCHDSWSSNPVVAKRLFTLLGKMLQPRLRSNQSPLHPYIQTIFFEPSMLALPGTILLALGTSCWKNTSFTNMGYNVCMFPHWGVPWTQHMPPHTDSCDLTYHYVNNRRIAASQYTTCTTA